MVLHDFIIESARKFKERSGVKPTHVIMSEDNERCLIQELVDRGILSEDRVVIRKIDAFHGFEVDSRPYMVASRIIFYYGPEVNKLRISTDSTVYLDPTRLLRLEEELKMALGPYWAEYEIPGGNDG